MILSHLVYTAERSQLAILLLSFFWWWGGGVLVSNSSIRK